MLLNRDDWYETSRDLDWTLSYADPEVAFPARWSGVGDMPADAWRAWDEPFRVSYRDYVRIQREKESGVKAVSSALLRAGTYEKLDPAHVAASHLHMGTTCMVEHMAVTMQSRFCRFAPSPRWRNLGVFGMLDETRHTQLDMRFSHDLLKHDQRFDWAQKAFHTNEWGVLAVKNFFDDVMLNADCVEAALATSLTVEHGFTNIQFVALAADAMAAGDINWSNLLSSIQTDEARHAQQGFPTLQVLVEHAPERAQKALDVAFWRSTRLFQTLTGPAMDYERAWLNEKYPTWEENWGVLWDEIIRNVNDGHVEESLPQTLPSLCNLTQLPLGSAMSRHDLAPHQLDARLTRASLERALGQPIQLAALEIDMPSFKGRLSTRTSEYVWFYVTQSA